MLNMQRLTVAAAILAMAGCTTSTTAEFAALEQTIAPAPPAPSPPPAAVAYVHDEERYGQLIVNVSYGDAATSKSLNACPETGLNVPNWDQILSGDRRVTAGFTIKTPDNQSFTIEPMTVTSKSRLFMGKECKTEFHRAEYRSPLYALLPQEGRKFVFKTSAHHTVKATDEVIKLIEDSTQLLLMTHTTTAPMAKAIADQTAKNLQSSGDDLTSTAGVDVMLDGTTVLTPYTYDVTVADKVVPVSVQVKLVNRASLFVTGADFGAKLGASAVQRVLQTPIRPGSEGQSAQTVEEYLQKEQPTAVQQLSTATTAAMLEAACANLIVPLSKSGMTLTDQAVARWALISKHSQLAAADCDQIKCLRDTRDNLGLLGIALTDPPPPPPPVSGPATVEQMRAALGWNGTQDNLIRFFKLNVDRPALAESLFAYPVEIVDPDAVLVRAGQTRLAHQDSWLAHGVAPDRPYFTNFGCYPAPRDPGIWRAGARIDTPAGPVDYDVSLHFRTDGQGPARIHKVELKRDPDALACR